jgi:hypothetical protein
MQAGQALLGLMAGLVWIYAKSFNNNYQANNSQLAHCGVPAVRRAHN